MKHSSMVPFSALRGYWVLERPSGTSDNLDTMAFWCKQQWSVCLWQELEGTSELRDSFWTVTLRETWEAINEISGISTQELYRILPINQNKYIKWISRILPWNFSVKMHPTYKNTWICTEKEPRELKYKAKKTREKRHCIRDKVENQPIWDGKNSDLRKLRSACVPWALVSLSYWSRVSLVVCCSKTFQPCLSSHG